MTYACQTPGMKEMPRSDVNRPMGYSQGSLSGQGHGRKITPGQSTCGQTSIRPQPFQTQTSNVYYNTPIPQTVYIPQPPVYVEQPVQVCFGQPVRPTCYPQQPAKTYHRYTHIHSSWDFFGFLAKCVLISALALFMLAILI